MSFQENITAQLRAIRSIVPPISNRQIHAACDQYEEEAARLGDIPNAIADALGWSRGTAAVVRRWSMERAAGLEPQIEVRL